MGIVLRFIFLCNLFFTFLFIFVHSPISTVYACVCNFPFFFFWPCTWLACFTWCSNQILLMWYHSSAVGWKTFVVWRFMKNQHLWSVWIHAGYNGGMFAQCNCMFHMVIVLPKSTTLMAELCRESSVFIHIAKIWAVTVVKVGNPCRSHQKVAIIFCKFQIQTLPFKPTCVWYSKNSSWVEYYTNKFIIFQGWA